MTSPALASFASGACGEAIGAVGSYFGLTLGGLLRPVGLASLPPTPWLLESEQAEAVRAGLYMRASVADRDVSITPPLLPLRSPSFSATASAVEAT